jgi:hypothetical protein
MDSGGRIYVDPSAVLMKALDLKPIKRPVTVEEKTTGKIGRNSPCGCGSGVKFKKCCYEKAAFDPQTEAQTNAVQA